MIQDKIFFDEKDPTGLSYNTPFTYYGSYQGRLWSKAPGGEIKYYTQNSDLSVYATTGSNSFDGNQTVTGSLTVTGTITGTVAGTSATASYVEYTNVANKPALVSGSEQIADFGIFATTGSNGFNGSQSITGSLTVTGQVVAQTLNVQQVTSSVVYSSGSNIFGNELGNTQQFTGSLQVSGSSHYLLGNVGIGTTSPDVFSRGDERNVGISVPGASNNLALALNAGGSAGRGAQIYMGQGGTRHFTVSSNATETRVGTTTSTPLILTTNDITRLTISNNGNIGIGAPSPGNLLALEKSSNSGSGSTFPRIKVINTLATQGDGTSTFNFADIMISAGNEAVNMFLATTYAAGTWAPAGIINVSTNHELQFKTNNTTRLTLANSGAATFSSSVTATTLTLSTTTADYAATITNVQDSSQGLLVRATDNDTTLYLLNLQSSNGATSQTWVDRFTVTKGGNVGIGTTSPNSKLEVVDGTGSVFRAVNNGTNIMEIGNYKPTGSGGSGYQQLDIISSILIFGTGTAGGGAATERMRITSGGDVGISNSNPSTFGGGGLSIGSTSAGKNIMMFSTSAGNNGLIQFFDTNAANAFQISASTTSINLYGYGSRNMIFNTNGTERMRITSGGYLKASNTGGYSGSSSPLYEFNTNQNDTNLALFNTSATLSNPRAGIDVYYVNAVPNNTTAAFYQAADNGAGFRTLRFEVRSNGGIANYQANDANLSDERTKKDIEPLESYWDKFKEIEIVKFKYKDQTHDDYNIGVIAQQVESVAPEFVDVDGWNTKPELDEEGNEIISTEEPLKSIYTADLYHATIKVLQEAMSKIEILESEIQTLKQQ